MHAEHACISRTHPGTVWIVKSTPVPVHSALPEQAHSPIAPVAAEAALPCALQVEACLTCHCMHCIHRCQIQLPQACMHMPRLIQTAHALFRGQCVHLTRCSPPEPAWTCSGQSMGVLDDNFTQSSHQAEPAWHNAMLATLTHAALHGKHTAHTDMGRHESMHSHAHT